MSFRPIVPVAAIKPERPNRVEFAPDHAPYAVAIFVHDGAYYAVEDRCTHVDYPLSEGDQRGDEVTCPLHGACFNIKTGVPSCGPCNGPVRTYPIRIINGILEIDFSASVTPAPFDSPDRPY